MVKDFSLSSSHQTFVCKKTDIVLKQSKEGVQKSNHYFFFLELMIIVQVQTFENNIMCPTPSDEKEILKQVIESNHRHL